MTRSEAGDAAARLAAVRARIAGAAAAAGRETASVQLVAVSKLQPEARIAGALEAGQRLFGENRVQEAEGRWPAFRERYPDIALRLVGRLQTNKVRAAVQLFDTIETLDRPRLAAALVREFERTGRLLPCFVQVNTGEEPQKGGVTPAALGSFLDKCRTEYGLDVAGLMCIPPAGDLPGPHFAFLREAARRHGLAGLSMGMSVDFETAIRFGATHVRIGTAVFGARG
ncbi:MAG: YggS family pyridoxal phosphate-dependent enzyme [Alphaproteobacteria bacterium]|nr:YggS family pyridoxal phosphate-dependent enzyme [Alphaproteobacteria bacterium]